MLAAYTMYNAKHNVLFVSSPRRWFLSCGATDWSIGLQKVSTEWLKNNTVRNSSIAKLSMLTASLSNDFNKDWWDSLPREVLNATSLNVSKMPRIKYQTWSNFGSSCFSLLNSRVLWIYHVFGVRLEQQWTLQSPSISLKYLLSIKQASAASLVQLPCTQGFSLRWTLRGLTVAGDEKRLS